MPSSQRTVDAVTAVEARAVLRAQHARLYPLGCPAHCADCRIRLADDAARVDDGDLAWLGLSIVAAWVGVVLGLAVVVLRGRWPW